MPESPIVLVIAVGNLLVQCGTKAKIDLKLDKMIVKQIFLGKNRVNYIELLSR